MAPWRFYFIAESLVMTHTLSLSHMLVGCISLWSLMCHILKTRETFRHFICKGLHLCSLINCISIFFDRVCSELEGQLD